MPLARAGQIWVGDEPYQALQRCNPYLSILFNKKGKMYKPTEKDLKIFKRECLRLADLWELNNWTFRFYIKNTGGVETAWVSRILDNFQADLYICHSSLPITESSVKVSARHEMVHILIGCLFLLGKSREFNLFEYNSQEEQLVHKLEKLLP